MSTSTGWRKAPSRVGDAHRREPIAGGDIRHRPPAPNRPRWAMPIRLHRAEHLAMSRTIGRLLAAWAWLLLGPIAAAQVAGDPDEPMPAGAAAPDVPEFDIEQWIFGGQGADAIRKRFEAALEQDIKRFDSRYGLTPAQKKKLELAGRLDIKRYFERVEDMKAEYKRAKGDWNK